MSTCCAPTLMPAHILVVDDDRTVQELAGQAFAPLGHIVTFASSGEDAVALAHVMQPDVIVMDLVMPGLGGDEAIETLKADPYTRAIPVVAMSCAPDLVQTALRTNADGILPKPFETDALVQSVETMLEKYADLRAPVLTAPCRRSSRPTAQRGG